MNWQPISGLDLLDLPALEWTMESATVDTETFGATHAGFEYWRETDVRTARSRIWRRPRKLTLA